MTNINSKKEIKDILTAMDELTKDELALEDLTPDCCEKEDPCDCIIPFCCSVTLPSGFEYSPVQGDKAKLAITKCCVRKIKCASEVMTETIICKQPVPVSAKVLLTKVFGCINFMFCVEGVEGDCGIELEYNGSDWIPTILPPELTAPGKACACCCGCACIDKIVDAEEYHHHCTYPMCDEQTELDCDNFQLVDFEVEEQDCDPVAPTPPPYACNKIVIIRGKLRLVGLGDVCPTPMP